jgi:hypothetical protein
MLLEPPESLQDGRYARRRRVGAGSYGEVWLYRDGSLDRSVAIKFFRRGGLLAGDEEARRLARLRHRNIVPVYDVLTWDEQPLLVMEFVRGATLQEHIAGGRTFPAAAARSWIEQLASALGAIHSARFVHCDFHPGNIIRAQAAGEYLTDTFQATEADDGTETFDIGESGRPIGDDYPVVLDFGVSRLRGDREQPALVAPLYRTPEWPEQDRLSDWYQLGLIAVQLLAGVDLGQLAARDGIMLKPPTHEEKLDNIRRVREVALGASAGIDDPGARRMVRTLLADVDRRRGASAVHEWRTATNGWRAPARRRPSRRLAAGGILTAVVVAGAGTGWALGSPRRAEADQDTVVAGPVRAPLPTAWRRSAGRAPTTIGGRRVAAGTTLTYPRLSGAELEIGLLRPGHPDPAPERLVAGRDPSPARIGSLDGFLFPDATGSSGTAESLFAVPTTAGYVLFGCRAALADFAAFTPVCRGLVGNVAISGADVEKLAPDAAYARFVGGRLKTLDAARRAAAAGLAHRSMAGRASAATAIARAYGAFADTLEARTPKLIDRARDDRLRARLRGAADAYASLAAAAGRHDRAAYIHAAAAVRTAEHGVRTALGALGDGGYDLPAAVAR